MEDLKTWKMKTLQSSSEFCCGVLCIAVKIWTIVHLDCAGHMRRIREIGPNLKRCRFRREGGRRRVEQGKDKPKDGQDGSNACADQKRPTRWFKRTDSIALARFCITDFLLNEICSLLSLLKRSGVPLPRLFAQAGQILELPLDLPPEEKTTARVHRARAVGRNSRKEFGS